MDAAIKGYGDLTVSAMNKGSSFVSHFPVCWGGPW